MGKSPLQKALDKLDDIELIYKDGAKPSGVVDKEKVKRLLELMEIEMLDEFSKSIKKTFDA